VPIDSTGQGPEALDFYKVSTERVFAASPRHGDVIANIVFVHGLTDHVEQRRDHRGSRQSSPALIAV